MEKERKEALEALENCEEFYLLVYDKSEMKAGYWNFGDYAKLIGCLDVAQSWFRKEMLKKFR